MKRILPYPLLAAALVVMWLLLAGITRGQVVLAVLVAVGATHGLRALGEISPKVRGWLMIPELFLVVLWDILLSNIAVARLILFHRPMRSGFIAVPLRLRDPAGLGLLSIIITSTPGTAWFDYSSTRSEALIHVLDLGEEAHWKELIANRYERRLLEIFK